jgi:eukaryotic-like serine/threonine-protein kinase
MIDRLPGDIFRQGQVLNHTYEIEGVLGRGGTGEVYRARNQISGRVVAIKALNSRFSGNDDYIELMRREEQMRDVLNDAVVRYTECSRSDQGHVFLVMDFIDGPSMSDVMARRRMEPRELMIIAHRVAEGLVAAHAHGIVHRDLSPDNIVLRDNAPERATIIDFGIAKDTAAGARTIVGNEFAGKYEYAAPEQLEGKAERRSDLYALGATLLASFRGQVPFAGSTPGEIVRRKQSKLDTEGVPDPLKGVIEWLSAPNPAERPASAEVVVSRLSELLKPTSTRGKRQPVVQQQTTEATGNRRGLLLLSLLLVGLAAAGAWVTGIIGGDLKPVLPIASPYELRASVATDGAATLSGNAPTPEAAQLLQTAYGTATGKAAPPEALILAEGVPDDQWVANVGAGLAEMADLEDWSFAVSDRLATISGLAPNRGVGDSRMAALKAWSAKSGFKANIDLTIGPRTLSVAQVQDIITPFADCGLLTQAKEAEGSYALGETVVIAGAVEAEDTAAKLAEALEAAIGDRTVRIDATILNPDLCTVRKVLPPLQSDKLSIWLGDGATGEVNLSGIYHAGDNPIVEVLAPADLKGLSLWVVVVDNTGKVFNLLPNINAQLHGIRDVGTVSEGQRRVRVIYSLAENDKNKKLMAFTVNKDSFGKSEVIAFLSKTSLFGIRRPRDESVASFAEALEEIMRSEPDKIVSIATRILDSRP